jgi:hypothetical protein
VQTQVAPAANNIQIVSNGNMTVGNGTYVTAVSTLDAGTVVLSAKTLTGVPSSLTLTNGVSTVNGNITLTADDDLILNAGGDVATVNGNVLMKADADSVKNGTSGALTMADGAVVTTTNGTITASADENVTLGLLEATNNATANAVSVTSTSAAILDADVTGAADIIAHFGTVTMKAATGIGYNPVGPVTNAIETEAPIITGDTTTGNINVNNNMTLALLPPPAIVQVNSLTTGNGNITFAQTGGADVYFKLVDTKSGSVLLTNVDPTVANGVDSKVIKVGDVTATTTATIIADGSIINDGIVGTDIKSPVATLTANYGTIGKWNAPVEVDVNGALYVLAGGMVNTAGGTANGFLSANLQGQFVESLRVDTNTPGLVLFNNTKFDMPSPFSNGTVYYFNNEMTNRWFKAIAQNDSDLGTDLSLYQLYLDIYGETIFAPYADMISIIEPGVMPEKDEKKFKATGDDKKVIPAK